MTAPESITLTLTNRDDVIKMVAGRAPDDLGSDVVLVDLPDRSAVIILGETVAVRPAEVTVGRGDVVRDRWRRRVTCPREGCRRQGLLVNADGSVRAHRRLTMAGATKLLGNTCRDPLTGKAHTPRAAT